MNVEHPHLGAIGDSRVNCGDLTCSTNRGEANGGQSVRVAAGTHELEIAASLAIGGEVGVAVPITVRVLNLDTYAYVGNGAQVRARRHLDHCERRVGHIGVTAGAGGAPWRRRHRLGHHANVHTYACTGTPTSPAYACFTGGANLEADGNVIVKANDDSQFVLITVAVAGGLVGVGLAVGVASLTKETEAYLGAGSFVVAKAQGGTLNFVPDGQFDNGSQTTEVPNPPVQRSRRGHFERGRLGACPAVAGGFVGVAGGVGVTLLSSRPCGHWPGSKINCQDSSCAATATGSNGAQSVNVSPSTTSSR